MLINSCRNCIHNNVCSYKAKYCQILDDAEKLINRKSLHLFSIQVICHNYVPYNSR